MVFVPLYLVPLTVTLQSFDALELIFPYASEVSCSSHLTTLELFATLWLTTHQLNFNVFHDVT